MIMNLTPAISYPAPPPMMSTTDLIYHAWGITGLIFYYGLNLAVIGSLVWIRYKIKQESEI
jgi:hypothetical protein